MCRYTSVSGLRKDVIKLNVNASGELCAKSDTNIVGTRKQEKKKLEDKERKAKSLQLQGTAEILITEGEGNTFQKWYCFKLGVFISVALKHLF